MGRDMEGVGSSTNRYELHLGDCMDVLKAIAGESVDSIVCDPPYHLTQASRGGHARTNNPAMPHGRHRIGDKGFMGKVWDGGDIAHRVELWAECLRVLKPGGHLLAFAGSRTYHRMTVAIEDSGFEIRDQIMWLYGSGFPKSKNLDGAWEGWGSALKPSHEPICMARKPLVGTVTGNVLAYGTGALNIDACRVPGEPVEIGINRSMRGGNFMGGGSRGTSETYVNTSGRWPANVIHDGSPEVLAAFPDAPGQMARAKADGTVSANQVYGALRNVSTNPGPRVELDKSAARFFFNAGQVGQSDLCNANAAESNSNLLSQVDGFAQNLAAIAAHHADKPLSDLIQRFMSDMASALRQIDETDTQMIPSIERRFLRELQPISTQATTENRASPAEVLALTSTTMIIQSLSSIAGSVDAATSNIIGTILAHGVRACARELRNRFMYCAKASRADRNDGLGDPGAQFKKGTTLRAVEVAAAAGELSGNTHPTVKPTDLMAYLCRLVTPAGGVVLDPFMGSGSTGKAAMREGFRFIGIDMTPEYVEIAKARIQFEADRVEQERIDASRQSDMFAEVA